MYTEGRLIVEFNFDDLLRIRSWHFAIRNHRELIPRSVIAMQVKYHIQDSAPPLLKLCLSDPLQCTPRIKTVKIGNVGGRFACWSGFAKNGPHFSNISYTLLEIYRKFLEQNLSLSHAPLIVSVMNIILITGLPSVF